MTTIDAKSVTAAVGVAIALLFLGTGTAHAVQDVSEHGAIAIIDKLPTPRDCGQCRGFNPQPDPAGNPDATDNQPHVGNPGGGR